MIHNFSEQQNKRLANPSFCFSILELRNIVLK